MVYIMAATQENMRTGSERSRLPSKVCGARGAYALDTCAVSNNNSVGGGAAEQAEMKPVRKPRQQPRPNLGVLFYFLHLDHPHRTGKVVIELGCAAQNYSAASDVLIPS